MREDNINENFELEDEIDIRDLDEEAQNKHKDIIEKIGLQDKINMEKALKEDEYIEEIDFVTVITKDVDEKISLMDQNTVPKSKMDFPCDRIVRI